MTGLTSSALSAFLGPWGAFVLGVLDASVIFFLPFGADTLVIYLAARHPERAWLYPLLTTAGSLTGAAVTYAIGRAIGEAGLTRFASEARLARLKERVRLTGAVAIALPALLPPPFPLTPFVLTSGALQVRTSIFFPVFGLARGVRFGLEALLAHRFGDRMLAVFETGWFQAVIVALVIVATVGSVASLVHLWRRSGAR